MDPSRGGIQPSTAKHEVCFFVLLAQKNSWTFMLSVLGNNKFDVLSSEVSTPH